MHAKRIRAHRWHPPSDALVLAGIDRAQRHGDRNRADREVSLAAIAGHLGMTWGPHASRRLRPILDRMAGELGWLRHSRRRSQDYWALTDKGREQLAHALIAGIGAELPEAPQHREWRAAREHAAARVEALRGELGELLARVNAMLDADVPPPATDWLAWAKPLKDLTVAVALAGYCLYERPEPDDARADRDESIEPSGSPVSWRNFRIWDPGEVT